LSFLRKIVLIEDHDNLRVALTKLLEASGHIVFCMEDAESFDENPIAAGADLFVVDLTLPGEDGLSFVRRLRSSNPTAFIIITSARTELDDRVLGYSSGANVYLQKPVEPDELLAIIEAEARCRTTKSDLPILKINALCLVYRGREVALSHAEALILHKLSTAKDMTLESWQLISLYCDEDTSFNVQNLQMRMSRLRKKLEQVGLGKNALISERGSGYRLTTRVKAE
jgi:DNA-binding response OmpR family regulator